MREHSKNGGFGHEISFVTKRGPSLQVAVFQRLKLAKKCAEVYEGQAEPTRSSRTRAPRRKLFREDHGCDLTAIQTTQRNATRPSSAMRDTPRE